PYKINAIKVGFIGDEEVLVSVAENGNVCVWRTGNLETPPIILRNDESTWGIAIHAKQKLIAVCANNHQITVFNMSLNPLIKQDDAKTFKSILGSDAECRLIGHGHNVPNIDFSECGHFIVSCSIDRSCRVWDLQKRKVISKRTFADLGRDIDNW
ncbi:WD40-repeat-containing domain protein, partial [Umbelopsis sp. PMI_123]